MMTHNAEVNKETSRLRTEFERIARDHETVLVRTSTRLCQRDIALAEDLVQDTLVRAYRAYVGGLYDNSATPGPWLVRILTNLFINQYRRKSKWDSGVDLDDMLSQGHVPSDLLKASPSDMPGVALIDGILDEELQQALSMLSEEMRQVVTLVDIEGLEYEEAAKRLGIPIGTVRSRLARARMKLHDLLQDFAKKRRLISS